MTFRRQLGSPQSLFERYPVAKRRGVPRFGEPIPETFLDCGRASWGDNGPEHAGDRMARSCGAILTAV